MLRAEAKPSISPPLSPGLLLAMEGQGFNPAEKERLRQNNRSALNGPSLTDRSERNDWQN
jgi:hypothetical protein